MPVVCCDDVVGRCRQDGRAVATVRPVAVVGCVFCGVVGGEVDAAVVLNDEVAVAFLDHRPIFRGHVLVVPREHVVTLPELPEASIAPFFRRVQAVAEAVPAALGAQGSFVANNNVVSQSVPHLHVHVVPRTKGDGLRGFFWPRTRYDDASEMASVADRIAARLGGIDLG
jgi:histidine triad (HIT) family protein